MIELTKAIEQLKGHSNDKFKEATKQIKEGDLQGGGYLDGISDGIDYALENLEPLIRQLIYELDVDKGGWSHL